MNSSDAKTHMNSFGEKGLPFFFLISYSGENCIVLSPEETTMQGIKFNFNGKHLNYPHSMDRIQAIELEKSPVSFEHYSKAYELVQRHLNRGNSYLVNLTFPSQVKINESLETVFHSVSAKYRILYRDHFVVYSPETFVRIEQGKIYTYPMKGTIDAALPKAKNTLLSNHKELAEHATIVDLLRNDLSRVASNVQVEKFRYIDEIKTAGKSLLQVSSEISGVLNSNYMTKIGDLIFELLPAGSISGAPKQKTLEIIKEAEGYDRGFYTGIAGFFDGKNMDSGVLIRYIEKENGGYIYKSGGGITTQSVLEDEYQELIDKIYVPFS